MTRWGVTPQHPTRYGVELRQKRGVAQGWGGHDGPVQRAVRTGRTILPLGREVLGQTGHEPAGLLGVSVHDLDHGFHVHVVVVGMPAIDSPSPSPGWRR